LTLPLAWKLRAAWPRAAERQPAIP
jgi:hypothetical protein